MRIINGLIYGKLTPKTSKLYIINGEIYPIIFLKIEAPFTSTNTYIQYRKTGQSIWLETEQQPVNETSIFNEYLSGLEPNTEYEVRAVVEWIDETETTRYAYSEIKVFKTKEFV